MNTRTALLLLCFSCAALYSQPVKLQPVIAPEKDGLLTLYRELHASPELSFHEENTSLRMASEMRKLGLNVTEKVGGWGVVAVLLPSTSFPRQRVPTFLQSTPPHTHTKYYRY